ncbi:hypothetical protein ACJX0J_031210, partial [Zea mays]
FTMVLFMPSYYMKFTEISVSTELGQEYRSLSGLQPIYSLKGINAIAMQVIVIHSGPIEVYRRPQLHLLACPGQHLHQQHHEHAQAFHRKICACRLQEHHLFLKKYNYSGMVYCEKEGAITKYTSNSQVAARGVQRIGEAPKILHGYIIPAPEKEIKARLNCGVPATDSSWEQLEEFNQGQYLLKFLVGTVEKKHIKEGLTEPLV